MDLAQGRSNRISQMFTADVLAVALTSFLLLNIILFRSSVEDWSGLAIKLGAALLWYPIGSSLARLIRHRFWSVAAHTALLVILFDLLFASMGPMQLVWVSHWMDGQVISLEQAVFGIEPSKWMQKFTGPVLTEWMSFAYIVYIPLLPLTGLLVFSAGGEPATREYLLRFTWVNALCYLGFLLYPIASQMHYYAPGTYTVPLEGWLFTDASEWVRAHAHFPGGSLPSPHCAAGTIQLLTFHRHRRAWFWWLLPFYITLYVSTVYLRYHYVTDAVVGILVGIIAWKTAPGLARWLARLPSPGIERARRARPEIAGDLFGTQEPRN